MINGSWQGLQRKPYACLGSVVLKDYKTTCSSSSQSTSLDPCEPLDNKIAMASEPSSFKVYFLPYLTPSHTIPLVDMAKLFAARGVDVTIFTTHCNSLLFKNSTDQLISSHGHKISLQLLNFPFREVGLPEGIENFSSATSIELAGKVFKAFTMLQQPMEQIIRENQPDCIVADMHYFWASDIASELGIPRLVFQVRCFFALCAEESVSRYAPYEKVQSEREVFLLPGIPHEIKMTSLEIPDWVRFPNGYTTFMNKIAESDRNSYGVVVESFYELEKNYADHYTNVLGRKTWSIGPVSLANNNNTPNKAKHDCMKWLDSKKPDSVLYISFGSLSCFSSKQLLEIAIALESADHPFIWVVRKRDSSDDTEWLPEGFENRIIKSKKGFIIRGMAPQILIINHSAIGGFLTHCGWNSALESVTAGVPMITWPLSAEQFYNEKLVTKVLKIGVEVGAEKWTQSIQESTSFVKRENIEKAVNELMGGGEAAEEMRRRAKQLGFVAKKAVDEGGSSYNNLTSLLEEIRTHSKKN